MLDFKQQVMERDEERDVCPRERDGGSDQNPVANDLEVVNGEKMDAGIVKWEGGTEQ